MFQFRSRDVEFVSFRIPVNAQGFVMVGAAGHDLVWSPFMKIRWNRLHDFSRVLSPFP